MADEWGVADVEDDVEEMAAPAEQDEGMQARAEADPWGVAEEADDNPWDVADEYNAPLEDGNIDLTKRPVVKNADGSISTVRSMSANIDGHEVLMPTVSEDGRIMSDDEAVDQYRKTGRHLGKFATTEDADAYAERLHRDQEKLYSKPDREHYSKAETAAGHGAAGALPGLGGVGAGFLAAGALGAGGLALPGLVVGGGGILAGLAVGYGIEKVQEAILKATGKDKVLRDMAEDNPMTATAAGIAPSLALLRPGKSVDALARLFSGAISGVVDTGVRLMRGQDVSLDTAATAFGIGAAFPHANKYGEKVIAAGANMVPGRYRAGNAPGTSPDVKQIPPPGGLVGEVLPPEPKPSSGGGAATAKPPEVINLTAAPEFKDPTAAPNMGSGTEQVLVKDDGVGYENSPGPRTAETAQERLRYYKQNMVREQNERLNEPDSKVLENPPVTEEAAAALDPSGEPPVQEGFVRLYRGETDLPAGEKQAIPDWVAQNPDFAASKDAEGRWFTRDRTVAEYYNQNHGSKDGRLSYADVPQAKLDEYLSANQPGAKKFSAMGRENEEYFVPKDVAAGRKPLKAARPPEETVEIDGQRVPISEVEPPSEGLLSGGPGDGQLVENFQEAGAKWRDANGVKDAPLPPHLQGAKASSPMVYPKTLDAVELSKTAREGIAKVQGKMASQQEGADFQGLTAPVSPRERMTLKGNAAMKARVEAAKPKPLVKAAAPEEKPLTDIEAKSLAEDRAALGKQNTDLARQSLEALDKLSPRAQHSLLTDIAKEVRQAQAAAEGKKPSEAAVRRKEKTGTLRAETRYKNKLGFLAGGPEEQAHHDRSIDVHEGIFKDFGPRSEEGRKVPIGNSPADEAAQKAYAQKVWDEAVKRNQGNDPLDRKLTYLPTQKGHALTDHLEWLRSIRDLKNIKKLNNNQQSAAAYDRFRTAHGSERNVPVEQPKREGDNGGPPLEEPVPQGPSVLSLAADTNRINQDIGRKFNGDAEVEAPYENEGRRDPDPWRASKLHSKQYNAAQAALREWIVKLNDLDYDVLSTRMGGQDDLHSNINTTNDPVALLKAYKGELAEGVKGRRPSTTRDLQPEADVTTTKEDIPNLNEGDRLKFDAQNAKEDAIDGTTTKAVEDRQAELARLMAEQTADDAPPAKKSLWDDDEGAIDLTEWKKQIKSMFGLRHDPTHPAASEGATKIANSIGKQMRDMVARVKIGKMELQTLMEKGVKQGLTAAEHRKISIAEQDNNIDSLSPKEKKFFDDFIVPIRTRTLKLIRDTQELFKEIDPENPLTKIDLDAVTDKAYQPRFYRDRQAFNREDTQAYDPFEGRGMGDYSPHHQDRAFKSAESGSARMVIHVGETENGGGNGGPPLLDVRIHYKDATGRKTSEKVDVPGDFEGKIGDTFEYDSKTWKVGHATTEEIANVTDKEFYENGLWQWGKAYDSIHQAYENAKLMREIKDTIKEKYTTTSSEEARKNGWSLVPTHLKEFARTPKGKDIYMPKEIVWVMDDFHKPGFGDANNWGIVGMRKFNTAMLKVFNTNSPLSHVFNEANLFMIGRGDKWLSPTGWKNLIQAFPEAIRSVNNQDHLQHEFIMAGGNPMLNSVWLPRMWERFAKKFGMDVMKDHSQWDPLARLAGVSTKELGRAIYELSGDITWRLSDILATVRYIEEKKGGDFGAKPKTPEEAAAATNVSMSTYQVGTTILGSRMIQQILMEPAWIAFGRYKHNLFDMVSKLVRDTVSPNATVRERTNAVAQWAMIGVMAYLIYPALDELARKISGKKNAEVRRGGVSALAEAVNKSRQGKSDLRTLTQRTVTPAPFINIAVDAVRNKDFANRPIVPQGEWPGIIPEAVGNVAEYGARALVPPYSTFSQHAYRKKGEGSAGLGAGAVLAEQFDVKFPSKGAEDYEKKTPQRLRNEAKQRKKNPQGVIPAAAQWVKRQFGG